MHIYMQTSNNYLIVVFFRNMELGAFTDLLDTNLIVVFILFGIVTRWYLKTFRDAPPTIWGSNVLLGHIHELYSGSFHLTLTEYRLVLCTLKANCRNDRPQS